MVIYTYRGTGEEDHLIVKLLLLLLLLLEREAEPEKANIYDSSKVAFFREGFARTATDYFLDNLDKLPTMCDGEYGDISFGHLPLGSCGLLQRVVSCTVSLPSSIQESQ